MVNTFAHWPNTRQGWVDFTAVCPCGTIAAWEQHGSGPTGHYRIVCRRCAPRGSGTAVRPTP
jgi:hypothetical protein